MRLIRWWGNVVLGMLVGAIAAGFVMNEWYKMAGRNSWDDDHPHWGLFVMFVVGAFATWYFLARAVYRWGQKRVENYQARRLREQWIDRRRDREMRDVMPRH